MPLKPESDVLAQLGHWLRHARIASGHSMAVFAQRIGVAESTVRAMERGSPSVKIGTWVTAIFALGNGVYAEGFFKRNLSLLSRPPEAPMRKRAPRQRSPRAGRSA